MTGKSLKIFYIVLGSVVGAFVGDPGNNSFIGAVGGAIVGFLLARINLLDKRIKDLELSRRRPQREKVADLKSEPLKETPAARPAWPTPESSSEEPERDFRASDSEADGADPVSHPTSAWDQATPKSALTIPPQLVKLLKKVPAWFTSGNVPVKIGVIITFIGVSFLLKYAIDHELVLFPVEFRLLAVAAGGLVLIATGWRLRERMRIYALSLQGGGVGVLFLTIFAAFRLWQLLPPALALVLLVMLTFFTGALAVKQNSRTLAILGIAGGFLAPILTSTGQGSHVLLFSYYLILNAAVLGIAWFRAWQGLNLVGFAFTFVIGSFWGYQYYTAELWASTQPFLLLHFLFYNAIAILYALRQTPERIGIVDGTLVFGTPVITSALQAALVQDTQYGLAISAASAAMFYVLVATWLYRSKGDYLRMLTESFIALAVAFATLAIPLALDARWTAGTWALEGAALVWIGTRQKRLLPRFAGVTLIFLSGVSFFEHGWQSNTGLTILNGNVLGGLLISLSALFASRRLEAFDDAVLKPVQKLAYIVLFLWGAFWWLGTGFMETADWAARTHEAHIYLLFLTASMIAAAWLGQSRRWRLLCLSTLSFLPFILLLSIYQAVAYDHLLRELGWVVWPLAWGAQIYLLRMMDKQNQGPVGVWHLGSLLLLTALLAAEASWWTGQVASTAWAGAVATFMIGSMALLVWRCRNRPAWLVPIHPVIYLNGSLILVATQLLVLTLISVDKPGSPEPFAYIPLLNPFDLAMLFAIVTSKLSLAVIRRESDETPAFVKPYKLALAAVFFILMTTALVRGVHFYTAVPWDGDALFNSVIVQTTLSISWGLLGFGGMIWGARKKYRPIWLAGTGFMVLVVIKLFLVDLGNTGTVERIVSFMGIGALLLVVGYFAPVPPRLESSAENDREDDRT